MAKKHFILSYHAAKAVRECVSIIYAELGIRLSICTPNFLKRVENCTHLIASKDLDEAYRDLSLYQKITSR